MYDPPYRSLFYQRVGHIHFLFSWLLFPRSRHTAINNRDRMPLGAHCHLEHAFNIHLNAHAIGHHFTCLHNVTLGAKGGKIPTIGHHVFVSCGACVIPAKVIRAHAAFLL